MAGNRVPSPEAVLEMLYHRELGYGLHDGADVAWSFRSALQGLGFEPTDADLARLRNHFIEFGYGKFDGRDDPSFRISTHGEYVARQSISRRRPIYSLRRLRTYDWTFWGAIASLFAAVFAFIAMIETI